MFTRIQTMHFFHIALEFQMRFMKMQSPETAQKPDDAKQNSTEMNTIAGEHLDAFPTRWAQSEVNKN